MDLLFIKFNEHHSGSPFCSMYSLQTFSKVMWSPSKFINLRLEDCDSSRLSLGEKKMGSTESMDTKSIASKVHFSFIEYSMILANWGSNGKVANCFPTFVIFPVSSSASNAYNCSSAFITV